MTGVDAQHVETRDKQIEEVCALFRRAADHDRAHRRQGEHVRKRRSDVHAHKVHTLAPWYRRIEESADVNLLTDDERKQGYYFKFVSNGLMQASAADRGRIPIAKALGSGGSPLDDAGRGARRRGHGPDGR
jgi:hypothetical protein